MVKLSQPVRRKQTVNQDLTLDNSVLPETMAAYSYQTKETRPESFGFLSTVRHYALNLGMPSICLASSGVAISQPSSLPIRTALVTN